MSVVISPCSSKCCNRGQLQWKSVVAISIGASLGALLRWWLGTQLNGLFPTIPPGTLAANLIGGYIIGLAIAFFSSYTDLSPEWRLVIMTFAGISTIAWIKS